MWVINSELMQQDGRKKKTENNKICKYNYCHAVHGIRFAVFFPVPSYCASSLPINYQIEFYAPINCLPQDGGAGQPTGHRLRKAHVVGDFDIHNGPQGGKFDSNAVLKSGEDLGMS